MQVGNGQVGLTDLYELSVEHTHTHPAIAITIASEHNEQGFRLVAMHLAQATLHSLCSRAACTMVVQVALAFDHILRQIYLHSDQFDFDVRVAHYAFDARSMRVAPARLILAPFLFDARFVLV